MAIANGLLTYGDLNAREDVVLNAIEIITAKENQISNTLGKTRAINMVHSYLTDTLLTAGSLAVEQNTDISLTGLTTPARLTNLVQEVAKAIQVARPQEVIQHYSGTNETERQTTKGLIDFGNAVEFDLVRSTLVSGVSGTVSKMAGIIAAISKSTNTSVFTSGTVFNSTILDAVMQDNWSNSNGDVVTDLFVGGTMKRIMDNFVQKTNSVVNLPNGITTIVKTVTTYETSMGTVTIHKHRYVFQTADSTARVLGIRPEKLKVAWLDMPFIKNLAESGLYSKRAIYGSLTLETHNQDSNFFYSGFLNSA